LRVWISTTENNKCHSAASATSAQLQRSLIPQEAAINSLPLIQKCSAKFLTQSCHIFSPSVINIFDNSLLEHSFLLSTLLIPQLHLSPHSHNNCRTPTQVSLTPRSVFHCNETGNSLHSYVAPVDRTVLLPVPPQKLNDTSKKSSLIDLK